MATIGIFDSGAGGLSVFREIYKLLPGEKYLYFSDNAYCPYGDKDASLILDRAREISDWMIFRGADIIVIACNTATAAAIEALREEYSKPCERVSMLSQGRIDHIRFIGMEPAVKPAAVGTRSGVIGVLATAGTLAGSKYLDTKSHIDSDVRIVEEVGQGFVELVEAGELTGSRAEEVIRRCVNPLLEAGADTIVLGCTHYPFLTDTIRKVTGSSVTVIDPAPAVARQLLKVMDEEAIPHSDDSAYRPISEADITLKASGPDDSVNRLFKLISSVQ